MTTIYNSDLFKELRDGTKSQQLRDTIPSQLAEKVVPVMEVNPKLLRNTNFILTGNKTNTGSTTIITLPTDKDTFLTNVYLSTTKDVLNDGQDVTIRVTVNGAVIQIAKLNFITLTAASKDFNLSLKFPVKLDRGTTITIVQTVGAGVSTSTYGLYGYQIENINA